MRLAWVLVLLCSTGLASTAAADGTTLPPLHFRLHAGSDIEVPVMIGGRGPFRFLLDTGSSRSAISASAARRLGVKAQAQTQTLMVTPEGRDTERLVELKGLLLGTEVPVTVLALLLSDDQLRRGQTFDGVIGQDVLSRLTFTIDYERRRLVWHTSVAHDVPGTRLQLELTEGRALVSLPQRSGRCSQLRLIPDSGANGLVLFAGSSRILPAVTPLDTAVLKTLSGHRVVRRVLIDGLDVGAIQLRDQIAVLVDRAADARLGDGLLPLHLFARVTFDGPGRYLIIEGRPER